MTDLKLVTNGKYERRDGVIITVTGLLSETPLIPGENDMGGLTEDHLFSMGYRFKTSDGDSYLPDGRYDVDEEESCLDLIKAVPQRYLILHDLDSSMFTVTADNPEDAVEVFSDCHTFTQHHKVYQLEDVTPDDISDRIDFMIKKGREVWDKYKIEKRPL